MSLLTRPHTARPSSSRPATALSRPWTSHSRPNTARPQTAASSRHESNYLIAIIEGRGVGREVGMAALDKDTGRVALIQVFGLYAQQNRFLTYRSRVARRLPHVCEDTASNAPPLPVDDTGPGYVHVCDRHIIDVRWEEATDNIAPGPVHHGGVRRRTH